MTPLQRKLLSVLATAPDSKQIDFPDIVETLPREDPLALAAILEELEIEELVTYGWPKEKWCYAITPAGRAALIPERSV